MCLKQDADLHLLCILMTAMSVTMPRPAKSYSPQESIWLTPINLLGYRSVIHRSGLEIKLLRPKARTEPITVKIPRAENPG
jgi:hypothetical protein